MIRRLPIIPTILVLVAVAVMIALGVWQIRRAGEKDALIAQYRAAAGQAPVSYPTIPISDAQLPLFRQATAFCLKPVGRRTNAGRNASGDTGFVHIVDCSTGAEGPGLSVELGWSKDPNARIRWNAGEVSGLIVPDRRSRMRIVAAEPAGGLQASVPPTADDIPNNHRSYAVQWFLFALAALVIYGLALHGRLKNEPPPA
ncbi:MAG: SURF1 family protein [Pseudomonadota bacterium]|nr:SURF1 family protein [Pseudomonadota bacterium]